MILVASDVRIGYEGKCNYQAFGDFLNACESIGLDHLVLLGDILDFWRRDNASTIRDDHYAGVFEKLGSLKVGNVHYVVGNHDYHILRLNERYCKAGGKGVFPFTVLKSLRLDDGGHTFYFTHGYEMEVFLGLKSLDVESYETFCDRMCFNDDISGGFASWLWDVIQKRGSAPKIAKLKEGPHARDTLDNVRQFAESRGAFLLLGMKPEERLVYGHTHKPFISDGGTIANTGSWVNEPAGRQDQNTYVKIADGQMELRIFGEDRFP